MSVNTAIHLFSGSKTVSLTERLKINASIQYVINSNVNGDQNRSETEQYV